MNYVSYGEVSTILDHRKSQNGTSVYELQVEWVDTFKDGESKDFQKYSWAPFTQIYKDVPQLVQEYFSLKKVSLQDVLNEEVQNRI
jgi:hypothetical protein